MTLLSILLMTFSFSQASSEIQAGSYVNYVCERELLPGYNNAHKREIIIFEQLDNSKYDAAVLLNKKDGRFKGGVPTRMTKVTGEHALLSGEGSLTQQVNSFRKSLGLDADSKESKNSSVDIVNNYTLESANADIVFEHIYEEHFVRRRTVYIVYNSLEGVNQGDFYNIKCQTIVTKQQGIREPSTPEVTIEESTNAPIGSSN